MVYDSVFGVVVVCDGVFGVVVTCGYLVFEGLICAGVVDIWSIGTGVVIHFCDSSVISFKIFSFQYQCARSKNTHVITCVKLAQIKYSMMT